MPNVLRLEKQIAVIGALSEGASIRAVERMTGIHRDTIMRLGVRVGEGCTRLLDGIMRDLDCQRIQVDELWGFINRKQRNVDTNAERYEGDIWTFVAIDADTKLVPSFRAGHRNAEMTDAFVSDLASRLRNRVQLTSDAMPAYFQSITESFRGRVDYAQIVKTYATSKQQAPASTRYSPPPLVSITKYEVLGSPDKRHVSTSFVERQNLTCRMHMRRLTRLTNGFSKRIENFRAAVGLHFGYYNLVKIHTTLRCTPAMRAGLAGHPWTVRELLEAAI